MYDDILLFIFFAFHYIKKWLQFIQEKMKGRWIKKIIFLNQYTKWKSKQEIIENFKNIKIDELFLNKLMEIKNECTNTGYII